MGNSSICGLETSSHLFCSLALWSLLPGLQNTSLFSKDHETEARWQCHLVPAASGSSYHASPWSATSGLDLQFLGLQGGSEESLPLYNFQKHMLNLSLGLSHYWRRRAAGSFVRYQIKHHPVTRKKSFLYLPALCFLFSGSNGGGVLCTVVERFTADWTINLFDALP